MSYSVSQKDNISSIAFEVSSDDFGHEVEKELFRSKDKMNLSVYRDGNIPPEVVQQMYDRNELVNRVIDIVIGQEFTKYLEETKKVPLTVPFAKINNCKKGEPFTFTVDIVTLPDVEVGTYVGVEVKKPDFEVTSQDIERVVNNFVRQHSTRTDITNRGVIEGDHLLIDFEGFLHGRPFNGNKANNFPLVIGSHSFVPGFEEELIGVGLNEAKDFTITYPADYRIEELAGKDVVFRCIVRRITSVEVPEFTDELVKEKTQFETTDALRDNIKKNLELQKRIIELNKKENNVIKSLVENSDAKVIPELVEQELKKIDLEINNMLAKNKITLEEHLKRQGLTKEQFLLQNRKVAENRSRSRLVLLTIAEKEGITVTPLEIEKEANRLAEQSKKSAELFKHPFRLSQMVNELRLQKALRFVMKNAKEVL